MSRIDQRLCLAGLVLFFLALLQGFAIPVRARRRRTRRTRGGAGQAFLIAVGLLWPKLSFGRLAPVWAGCSRFRCTPLRRPDVVGYVSGGQRSVASRVIRAERHSDDQWIDRAGRIARRGHVGVQTIRSLNRRNTCPASRVQDLSIVCARTSM
jgi:hypothetical protein